jgi:hypothetical protein
MFGLVGHNGFKQLSPPGWSCQVTLSQAKTHGTSVKLNCLSGQFTVRTAENFNQVNLFALSGVAMLGNQKLNLKTFDKFLQLHFELLLLSESILCFITFIIGSGNPWHGSVDLGGCHG